MSVLPRLHKGAWAALDSKGPLPMEAAMEMLSVLNVLITKLTRLGTFVRGTQKQEAVSMLAALQPFGLSSMAEASRPSLDKNHRAQPNTKEDSRQSNNTSVKGSVKPGNSTDDESPYVSTLDISADSYEEMPEQIALQYRGVGGPGTEKDKNSQPEQVYDSYILSTTT